MLSRWMDGLIDVDDDNDDNDDYGYNDKLTLQIESYC